MLIRDKITYGGEVILTLYHIGFDDVDANRKLKRLEKIGKKRIEFTEEAVDDSEIVGISGWVDCMEGLASSDLPYNPYNAHGACAAIKHYRFIEKPTGLFSFENGAYDLSVSTRLFTDICRFTQKYTGVKLDECPMICGDILITSCVCNPAKCQKDDSLKFENVPANSEIIVHFKQGELIVSSKILRTFEDTSELTAVSDSEWKSCDIAVFVDDELQYYRNDLSYVRSILFSTRITNRSENVELKKISRNVEIAGGFSESVTRIGEKPGRADEIYFTSGKNISKQLYQERPDDKVTFIRSGRGEKALEIIKYFMASAVDELWVFDSYISSRDQKAENMDWIRIVSACRAEHKRIVFSCIKPEKAFSCNELADEIRKENILRGKIRHGLNLLQTVSPIHDRFIIIRNNKSYSGLIIGTSLNSIEKNYFCITEINHSSAKEILDEFELWMKNGNLAGVKEL